MPSGENSRAFLRSLVALIYQRNATTGSRGDPAFLDLYGVGLAEVDLRLHWPHRTPEGT